MDTPRLPAFALLVPLLACVAKSEGADTGAGSTETGLESSSTESGGADTTETTGESGETTEGMSECPWYWPEYEGMDACPEVELGLVAVAGETPYGPVAFDRARYGLFICAPCPTAEFPMITLYTAPDAGGEPGDYLDIFWYDDVRVEGRIGGQYVTPLDANDEPITLEFLAPSIDATSPPGVFEDPPPLTGSIEIAVEGWSVSGMFGASLCTGLNWTIPCE